MKIESKIIFTLDGVTYKKGTHELKKGSEKSWFFLALVKDKKILILEEKSSKSAKPKKPEKAEISTEENK